MLVLCVHTYVDTRLTLGLCTETYKKAWAVKWSGECQYSGVDQRLRKVVGTKWILVGVYITHSTLGGLGACSPRNFFF